jgi:hypothetical protein
LDVVVDRSKETARDSVDRAFASLDKADEGQSPDRVKVNEVAAAAGALFDGDPDGASTGKRTADAVASLDVPARFSTDAKTAWASVPDNVKGEVNRAIREIEDGLGQYQQFFEPLKPFYQMAHQAQTTVHEALKRYTDLDAALISDEPRNKFAAIQSLIEHAGISPREYAALVLRQQPDQVPAQSEATIRALQHQVSELRDHLGGMSQSIQKRHEDEILAYIDKFAVDHPRLNDLDFQEAVTKLLEAGMATDLEGAYAMAERLKPAPATREPQNPGSYSGQTKPSAQTRNGNLSVTGAPGSGSNPVKRKAPQSAKESIDNAFASLGLG